MIGQIKYRPILKTPKTKGKMVKPKSGFPVYIYLYQLIENKKKEKLWRTGVYISDAKNWSTNKRTVLKNEEEYYLKNAIIESKLNKIQSHILSEGSKGKKLTIAQLLQLLEPKTNTDNFIEFCYQHIKESYKLSPNTIKSRKSIIRKLEMFNPKLSFSDVENEELIDEFEKFLYLVIENDKNTVLKALSVLRTFVKIAIKDGKISNYIFKDRKISKMVGVR